MVSHWTPERSTARAVRTLAVVAAAAGLALPMVLTAPTATATTPARPCAELSGVRVPAPAIGLPTRGAEVTTATVIPAAGSVGSYCRLEAAIHPVDRTAPDIRMRLAIPDGWNRKVMMFGGGGYNGTIPNIAGPVPFGLTPGETAGSTTPLARGYATFASDSGHQADLTHAPSPSLDGSFGLNDEALRNFTGDALKKTRDTALYLLARGRPDGRPTHSYFAGGSTGGREALAVAQRWPRDFDGVISVYPAWNSGSVMMFMGHLARVLAAPGAFPNPAKQKLLYDAVVNTCDPQDGLRDRLISNEAGCDFDPGTIRCPGGADTGDTCLSDRQISAVRSLSSPVTWDYPVASGETSHPGFPFLSGADMRTPLLGMGSVAPANPMPVASGYGFQYWEQWVKYFLTRDPGQNSLAVDPLRPGRWQSRISRLSVVQDVNDTDLSAFRQAGGRLLILHGTADELVSHWATVDYYRRMRATMGPAAVDAFARLYLIPGANHGPLLPAFAPGWDSVTALDDWVTRGQAPHRPVVADNNPGAARTRPLCEYPTWPRYVPGADPDSAAGFTCVTG